MRTNGKSMCSVCCTFGTLHYDPQGICYFRMTYRRPSDTPDERLLESKNGCIILDHVKSLHTMFFPFGKCVCVFVCVSSCIRLLQAPIQFAITCVICTFNSSECVKILQSFQLILFIASLILIFYICSAHLQESRSQNLPLSHTKRIHHYGFARYTFQTR